MFAGMLAAAILVMAGCAGTQHERTAGEYMSDKTLVARVNRALGDQPVYKFPGVKVNTFRGVVQLSGFVSNEQQKEVAAEIASRVRGVSEVRNDIAIAPLGPPDRTPVRDYIPGREDADERAQTTNRVNRSSGAAPSGSGINTGNRIR